MSHVLASPATVAAIVGSAKADPKAVQASGHQAKGSALAAVLIPILRGDAIADEKRGQERYKVAVSLHDLSPEGHQAFRRELEAEKATLRELAKSGGVESRIQTRGLSEGSFMVYCSQWATLSKAFEAGMPLTKEANVACLLANARHMLAQMHAKGETEEEHNPKGAGRKAKDPVQTIIDNISKLSDADKARFIKAYAKLANA